MTSLFLSLFSIDLFFLSFSITGESCDPRYYMGLSVGCVRRAHRCQGRDARHWRVGFLAAHISLSGERFGRDYFLFCAHYPVFNDVSSKVCTNLCGLTPPFPEDQPPKRSTQRPHVRLPQAPHFINLLTYVIVTSILRQRILKAAGH